MTRAAARRRAAIVISIGVQAALIAAILAIPALRSTHHAQAVRAVPTAVPQPPGASYGPGNPIYPTGLTLSVRIDGVDNVVGIPTREPGTLPVRVNYIPPGKAARVTVTFPPIRLGLGEITNIWFAVAPASAADHQLPQLGDYQETMIPLQSTDVPTIGVRMYQFTVPAADLRPGDFPIIVMGIPDVMAITPGQSFMYGIAQLNAP
jgi:hypothetical protein